MGSVVATRSGAYGGASNNVLRSTLTTTAQAVCESGPQEHRGSLGHKVRVYGDGTGTIWVRLAFKVGSSPRWRENDWVELPFLDDFCELDLGLMHIREPVQGTQSCEWRIEAYSETAGDTLDIDYDQLIPAGPHFKARTPIEFQTPTSLTARDGFNQTAGALNGKTAEAGGNWATSGTAGDFQVSGSGTLTRATTSDASSRVATLTLPTYSEIAVAVDLTMSAVGLGGTGNGAQTLLHADGKTVTLRNWASPSVFINGTGFKDCPIAPLTAGFRYRLGLMWISRGLAAFFGPSGKERMLGLVSGGTGTGTEVGLMDSNLAATACTRTFDNFAAWIPTPAQVLYANKSLEVHSDQITREHSSGEWGRVDSTGGYPTLPPGRPSRIAVKARRNDTDQLPDDVIDDELSVQVEITPRLSIL